MYLLVQMLHESKVSCFVNFLCRFIRVKPYCTLLCAVLRKSIASMLESMFSSTLQTLRKLMDLFSGMRGQRLFCRAPMGPKSLCISRPVSNFYGTEIEIWAGFGPVGSTEKKLGLIMSNF